MLEHAGLKDFPVDSADFVHRIAEAANLAMADRLAWLGDPRFVDVPFDALLSLAYLRRRASMITGEASAVLRPGSHWPTANDPPSSCHRPCRRQSARHAGPRGGKISV